MYTDYCSYSLAKKDIYSAKDTHTEFTTESSTCYTFHLSEHIFNYNNKLVEKCTLCVQYCYQYYCIAGNFHAFSLTVKIYNSNHGHVLVW